MQIHRFALQRDMACCLLRGPMPEVVIDWVDLVFGISLPVGGRTIALLDQVSPITEQNTPKAQQHFLNGLKGIVGNKQCLVMMSDGCRAWIGILSDAGKRAQAPGLVHTSLSASQACASKRVNRYAQRMPIEEAFRDLKSRRFGVDLEHRQSRKQER